MRMNDLMKVTSPPSVSTYFSRWFTQLSEVAVRSSSSWRSTSIVWNPLVKLVQVYQRIPSSTVGHSKWDDTNENLRSLPSSSRNRALSSFILSSGQSYITGELNVWNMFGIVLGTLLCLVCFYFVVKWAIQGQVEERIRGVRSIEEVPLVPSSANRRSRSSNTN